MKIFFTRHFKAKYKKLPANVKQRAQKQIKLLMDNPRHPSLNIKKMNDPRDIWEIRVNKNYRITFHFGKNICVLRNIGTHNILKKP